MFGTGGVEQVLRADQRGSMSDLMAKVLQAVHLHASGGAQADDMTIVLLARSDETAGRTTVQQYFPRSFEALGRPFRFFGHPCRQLFIPSRRNQDRILRKHPVLPSS